jgi:hypothetical protein
MAATAIFPGNTVFVSAPSVSVAVGSHTFGPVPVPSSLTSVVVAFDITNHGAGNTSAVSAAAEISFDGGANWQPFFSFARDKGYAPVTEVGVPPGWAYMLVKLPEVGNANRQVRGTLTVANAPLTTAVQVEGQ